jgi:hypothetical protein
MSKLIHGRAILFIIGVSAFSFVTDHHQAPFHHTLRDFLDLRGLGLSLGLAVTLELGHFVILIRY